MLCRADSSLDELSPIQTPFLIASLRRSRTRANSPVPLIRTGGEEEREGSAGDPAASRADRQQQPFVHRAAARGVLCSIHLPAPAAKALPGRRGMSEASSAASSVLPGQEGIHAANVMISAQEGDGRGGA